MTAPLHPTSASDELAIRNLIVSVSQLTDFGDVEDYLDLYTDDRAWELPSPNIQAKVAATRRAGRDQIRAGVLDRRAAGVQGPGSNTMHVVSTILVHFRGPDVAIASSYFQYYTGTDAVPELRSVGHYRDVVRRTGQGWRLAHRRLTTGGPPVDDLRSVIESEA